MAKVLFYIGFSKKKILFNYSLKQQNPIQSQLSNSKGLKQSSNLLFYLQKMKKRK